MIAAYLIVTGVLAMVAGYVALWNHILTRVEQRDLAALAQHEKTQIPHRTEVIALPVAGVLPAPA